MPVLHQHQHGGSFYIVSYGGEDDFGEERFGTWQVDMQGMRVLGDFGIQNSGDVIPRSLFETLRDQGLIWNRSMLQASKHLYPAFRHLPLSEFHVPTIPFETYLEVKGIQWKLLMRLNQDEQSAFDTQWLRRLVAHSWSVTVDNSIRRVQSYGPRAEDLLRSLHLETPLSTFEQSVRVVAVDKLSRAISAEVARLPGLHLSGTLFSATGRRLPRLDLAQRDRYCYLLIENNQLWRSPNVAIPGECRPTILQSRSGWTAIRFTLPGWHSAEIKRFIERLDHEAR